MSYYPYFFTLKWHLRNINTEIFPRSLYIIIIINYYVFPQSRQMKKICFASIIVTAIILLKYWVLNFYFFFKQLVLGKKLNYRFFFTQTIPAFNITTLSKFLSVFVCVRALDSLINYSFFINSVFEKALLSLLFYTQYPKSLLYRSWFFLPNFYPYTLSLLFVEGHLRTFYLQLGTGSTQEDPSRHNWKIVDWK